MRVTVDRVYEGRAVDLGETDVDAAAVVRAVRASDAESAASVVVECPDPGPLYDHVGVLPPSGFDRRAALAAAARSVGHTAAEASALADARERLASLSPPAPDLRAARRRVAEAGAEEERLRERVAELRGRLAERRETGADAASVEDALSAAVGRLSEVETERIAAEQALDRAEREARAARDRRQRRLELQDRVANLEREVRADLARSVWPRFAAAVETVPGGTEVTVGDAPGTYEGDPTTAALAVARLGRLDAPVVLDGLGRFADATAAASTLDAPVVRV
ncbi:MAG: hypothetical protein ABEJ82_10040 [Haloplanus sp.]